jgi:TatA/E family protein of Tat protein translocase
MKEANSMVAFMNDTGILVAVLALILLLGASRLPKLARNLGEAGKEFRKAQDEAAAESGHEETVTISRAQFDALVTSNGREPEPLPRQNPVL